MNYFLHKNKNGGYIALMATIIISLVLLVMIVKEGATGWSTRFLVLGAEAKEQANALAEGCLDQAIASLVTNTTYAGGTTSDTPGGTCKIFSIDQTQLAAGVADIKTQAVVRDAYANLESLQDLGDIHVGVAAQPQYGIIVVQTVVNNNGTNKLASDFMMHVSNASPSKGTFQGSVTGVVVTLVPAGPGQTGQYSVSEDTVPGFSQNIGSGCSGTVNGGDVKTCTVTNTAVTTTLTLIANVINDNSGTMKPSDFSLKYDTTTATLGTAYAVTPGTHTASAIVPSGYGASSWGYDCSAGGSVTLAQGDHKVCIINFDDNPPPTTSCADTVVMFDRSGSMTGPNTTSGTDLYNEKFAGNSLLGLYSNVSPLPQVGIGSFGGLDGSSASIPTIGQLTGTYGTSGSSGSPAVSALAAGNYDQWTANTGTKASAVASNDGNTTYISGASGQAETFVFTGANVPAGATITSVVLSAVALESGGNASVAFRAEKGTGSSNRSDGSTQNLSSSYATYTRTMNTNPFTGSAWSVSEVNNWTTKFGLVRLNTTGGTPRATQLSLTVTYTTPTSGLYSAIATITGSNSSVGTDLNAAITTASNELTGSRHKAGFKQVLILVSDGEPNQPSGNVTTPNIAPTANGNYTGFTPNTGTAPTAVSANDGDTSYVTTSLPYQTFAFPGASVPAGMTITSVTLSAVARASTTPASIQLMAESGTGSGQQAFGSTINLTTSYTTNSWQMTTNPITNNPWTLAEVNAWATKFGIANANTGVPRVTQLSISVAYTQSGTSNTPAPAAVGNYDQWSANGSSNKVTDVAVNDTTNYISTNTNGNAQTFTFSNAGVPAGATITSVVLSTMALESGGNASIALRAEKGTGSSNRSDDVSQNLSSSYSTYSRTMTTNPFTGNPWTLTEVNAWTTKFGVVRTNNSGGTPRVTQLDVAVNYVLNGVSGTMLANALGNYSAWTQNTGTQISAIGTSDADTSYVFSSVGTSPIHTFVFGGANVPTSNSIASVSVYAVAEEVGGNATMQFVAEKGTGAGQQSLSGSNLNLSGSYATYSHTWNTNPFTGSAWTATEVNAWTTRFGVQKTNSSGGTPRITELHITVTYNSDPTGAALAAASSAKTSGIEIFTVRYSPDTNATAISLLKQIATNASDYFASPTTPAGIGSIFNTIAAQVCPAVNNPTPPPPPTTATLLVLTNVINNDSGTAASSDFTTSMSGTNPSITSAPGSSTGTTVIFNPGDYSVSEDPKSGYTEGLAATCSSAQSGVFVAGESRVCIITDDDIPPPPPAPNLTITPGSWQEVPDTNP